MNVEGRVGNGVTPVGRRFRAGSAACVSDRCTQAAYASPVTRLDGPAAATGLLGSGLRRWSRTWGSGMRSRWRLRAWLRWSWSSRLPGRAPRLGYASSSVSPWAVSPRPVGALVV